MTLLKAFLNVMLADPDPAPLPTTIRPPAPAPVEVEPERLLDLAVLMRDVWLPSAGFGAGADRARSLVLAALFRIFPAEVGHLAEDCAMACGPKGCGECTRATDLEHEFRRLDAHLRGLDRPAIATPAEIQ